MLKPALIAGLIALSLPGHTATIYLCRAYNGSTFWAQQHCSKHNALIERMENVADVPWDQQVQQARSSRDRARQATAAPTFNADQRCGQLLSEKREIEGRYTNWQWQPPEVINPDQQRQRAIDAELRHLRCHWQ